MSSLWDYAGVLVCTAVALCHSHSPLIVAETIFPASLACRDERDRAPQLHVQRIA